MLEGFWAIHPLNALQFGARLFFKGALNPGASSYQPSRPPCWESRSKKRKTMLFVKSWNIKSNFVGFKMGPDPSGQAWDHLPIYKLDLADPIFRVSDLKKPNLLPKQPLKTIFVEFWKMICFTLLRVNTGSLGRSCQIS